MKRIVLTVAVTLAVLIAIPVVILATGVVDMAATNEPGSMERSLAAFAIQRSLAMRAPEKSNPVADDPQAIETGLQHYASMCARCHGGPGVAPEEFAKGLNPPAPELGRASEEFTQGELFWITKHGIRMTGMPAFGETHSDENLWRIVTFLAELPNLSPEQQRQLSQQAGQPHGHESPSGKHAGTSGHHQSGSSHQHGSANGHGHHAQETEKSPSSKESKE